MSKSTPWHLYRLLIVDFSVSHTYVVAASAYFYWGGCQVRQAMNAEVLCVPLQILISSLERVSNMYLCLATLE
jgi:hypothetical protein